MVTESQAWSAVAWHGKLKGALYAACASIEPLLDKPINRDQAARLEKLYSILLSELDQASEELNTWSQRANQISKENS